MEEKRELIFAIYRSEITGKYYVKYKDSDEKEITRAEYDQLLHEKERILEFKTKKE
jgi:3-methyladenine DNA glycosylase AlkD